MDFIDHISKVIEKNECFWDKSSTEYLSRHSATDCFGSDASISLSLDESEGRHSKSHSNEDVREKINFLNLLNRQENEFDDIGLVLDGSAIELGHTSRALYAEDADDVVILFTDIVGFSRMSLTMMVSSSKLCQVISDLIRATSSLFNFLLNPNSMFQKCSEAH